MAERRVTSVLFGDLVGFTPLSESKDSEEVRELLSAYFQQCRVIVARYGGVIEAARATYAEAGAHGWLAHLDAWNTSRHSLPTR